MLDSIINYDFNHSLALKLSVVLEQGIVDDIGLLSLDLALELFPVLKQWMFDNIITSTLVLALNLFPGP